VLGGDRSVGTPRAVEHAWQLREMLRTRDERLILGGWANPHADPARQVEYLTASNFSAEFYLTQIVSHHNLEAVRRFMEVASKNGLEVPGIFGVFFYRSANPRTLNALRNFIPVPAEELSREFEEGASPEEVCARSIRALREAGARHFYISNLPIGGAAATLERILRLADRASGGNTEDTKDTKEFR
jgi:5,10-methylenetetrahydrofolate reductase